jgi:hypothetical protein
VAVASSPRARLLGLAGLESVPLGVGLLLPRCRSVHTLGMRIALDVLFLDAEGEVVATREAVGPGRLASCRRARHALETAAGQAHRFTSARAGVEAIAAVAPVRARAAWRGSPS